MWRILLKKGINLVLPKLRGLNNLICIALTKDELLVAADDGLQPAVVVLHRGQLVLRVYLRVLTLYNFVDVLGAFF